MKSEVEHPSLPVDFAISLPQHLPPSFTGASLHSALRVACALVIICYCSEGFCTFNLINSKLDSRSP